LENHHFATANIITDLNKDYQWICQQLGERLLENKMFILKDYFLTKMKKNNLHSGKVGKHSHEPGIKVSITSHGQTITHPQK
jgi:hypothetical protein